MQQTISAWSMRSIHLDLKYVWKISRNSSAFKTNFIVQFEKNGFIGIGEVAPNIRYQETTESIQDAFAQFQQVAKDSELTIENLQQLKARLNLPNALAFGIEQAWINWQIQQSKTSLGSFLNITPKKDIPTCYTLPIMEVSEMKAFYEEYHLARFPYLKIKVNKEHALDELKMARSISNQRFMIDANESWTNPDDVIQFIKEASRLNVAFVEQPMPASLSAEYVKLKIQSWIPIMADESVCHNLQIDEIKNQFHGVNMKLMKAGGIINGLQIINVANQAGLITMTGCMIETTLGMSAAWLLAGLCDYADLDGYMAIKNEPFHFLEERNGSVYETQIN